MNVKRTNQRLFIVFIVLVLYCAIFVLTHGNILFNRYTDIWWHISAADEYSLTGIFAKDPFIQNVPLFAPFGLYEFSVAWLHKLTGISVVNAYLGLQALGVVLFLLASYCAGYLIRRRVVDATISVVISVLVSGGMGIIFLGFPFYPAMAGCYLLTVVLWSGDLYERMKIWQVCLTGIMLGVVFITHPFPGLIGCVISGVAILVDLKNCNSCRLRALKKGIIFSVCFLLVSWRWIILQLSLRPVLSVMNQHVLPYYAVPRDYLAWLIIGLVVLVCLLFNRQLFNRYRKLLIFLLVFGGAIAFLCLPVCNGFVARNISWYMARRIPLFFPIGIVAILALTGAQREHHERTGLFVLHTLPFVLCVAMLLPASYKMALKHVYLLRTNDYNIHPYSFLSKELGDTLRGKNILSDPMTSYFARGMIGTYAISTPPGHGSPAVDYKHRDKLVVEALRNGPLCLQREDLAVDALLICRKKDGTAAFAGVPELAIVKQWQRSGWIVAVDTDDLIVMIPSDATLNNKE